ncbi:hypothetical protein EYZ11_002119 [Aspergillus tanneri]|uniref:Uncharacterized protein n=1 Tax=Aspergillus tanneri TaxID=1220188 RepID=A0A4S3JSC9_9EURO|nr:hypothetical protein EYZ11_002119 [Aspergillus tanneri]
MTSYLPADSGA